MESIQDLSSAHAIGINDKLPDWVLISGMAETYIAAEITGCQKHLDQNAIQVHLYP
jgi:hypothetical protein